MLELDIEQFWKDDELAHKDDCFCKDAPQVALGIRMSDECVFAELGEKGQPWGHTPLERRNELNKRYNDKAMKIVGKRLLGENMTEEEDFPYRHQIGEVFGGEYYFDGQTTWLQSSCSTPKELEKILDRVDNMDLKSFIFPENWESEKKRLYEKYGKTPAGFHSIRGPITLATSIYGVENFIYLLYDAPELADRFRDTITKVTLAYIELYAKEARFNPSNQGFGFNDDNCYLLNPQQYERFGYPILKEIFDKHAPRPHDHRYQHSDSDMGHLLPILSKLNLTGCNFGPTVMISDIRKYMKDTRIDGQLAPFTFMRNNTKEIIKEVKRDCKMAKIDDIRGVNLTTAGSINNGSLLTSMRTVMAAIQNFGRYD